MDSYGFAAVVHSGTHEHLFPELAKNRDECNNNAHEDYSNPYALYAFEISPVLAEGHLDLSKEGTVRIELQFAATLANTVTVIAYPEFEKIIEIAVNRKTNLSDMLLKFLYNTNR